MSRTVSIVILCEDRQHEAFAFRDSATASVTLRNFAKCAKKGCLDSLCRRL
jgi:hypothetical protein